MHGRAVRSLISRTILVKARALATLFNFEITTLLGQHRIAMPKRQL
jgi:hypothetical protein